MAGQYLQRNPTSTGNRRVHTWSGWVKQNKLNTASSNNIWYVASGGTSEWRIFISNTGNLIVSDYIPSPAGIAMQVQTTRLLRDHGNWFHLLVSVDTTKSTASERLKVYIDGVLITDFSSTNYGSQNHETRMNAVGEVNYLGQNTVGGGTYQAYCELFDVFSVDGQALTPEVFGFYKDGNGYISAGSTQATDFRNGQWVPRTPREIKNLINDNGGFGVNGFYLPMNDSSNVGADFHTTPNSIITLKGENLAQPRNGAPETTDAYVSQLRSDPYAANLVLAVPGISTATGPNLVTNGNFDSNISGWAADSGATLSHSDGSLRITVSSTAGARQSFAVESGKRYTLSFRVRTDGTNFANFAVDAGGTINYVGNESSTNWVTYSKSFIANSSTAELRPYKALGGWAEFDDIVFKQEDAPRDYSADIKGSGTNKTLTANGNAGVGYEIPSYYGSAMTFDGTGDYFSTTSGASDFDLGTDDFTIEGWVYTTSFANYPTIINVKNTTASSDLYINFRNSSTLALTNNTTVFAGSSGFALNQWNHFALVRSSGSTTMYGNGVAGGPVACTVDFGASFTGTTIGAASAGGDPFSGYIQDLRIYKGVAKYKGGFDVPKPYTPVGIESFRAVSDTCQNNFATWNPLQNGTSLTDGNLTCTGTGANQEVYSTIGITTGKWYVEARTNVGTYNHFGVRAKSTAAYGSDYRLIARDDGLVFGDTSQGLVATLSDNYSSAGDIVAMAINGDDGELTYYINGKNVGGPYSIYQYNSSSLPTPYKIYNLVNSGDGLTVNFGQNPTFSGTVTAGTYTDSNGKGLFKYQPPSGFLALCEDNLPTPAIKDPGKYFKTVLYTGTGSSKAITGVGFKPDLIWVKSRTNTEGHIAYDSVRGPEIRHLIHVNTTESTSTGGVISFDDDGYSTGTYTGTNQLNQDYVAWCWKAGGAAVTNTDGSLISKISVSQDAGFSIGTFTGNVTNTHTIGHGLGKVPSMIIVKERNANSGWAVYHKDRGNTKVSYLDAPDQEYTESGDTASWNTTDPTSSVFYVGKNGATNDNNLVFYAWTEIEGFSKFGSYVGNLNADGPFVYCGFKPAFVLIKLVTGIDQWFMCDSSRSPTNPVTKRLDPSDPIAEVTNFTSMDFLSNGFKLRTDNGQINNNGGTYIFAAFAESPFQTANAK